MTEFCIICFDRVSLRLALGDFIATKMVPEGSIGVESITVIPFGFGTIIDNLLKVILSTFPDNLPAQEAARCPIYIGYEVDPVFFSPMKVKSSSSSAFSTFSGTAAGGRSSA